MKRWLPFLAAAVLVAVLAIGAPPAIRNTLLIPVTTDESNFPATAARTTGALVFGLDGGNPYWSPGDGGAWQVFSPGTVASVYVNAPAVASTTYGGGVLPTRAFTVQALRYRIRTIGSGGTTNAVFRVTDGTNNCDCGFACNLSTGSKHTTCTATTGTCALQAGASLTYSFNGIGDCSTGPDIMGNIDIEGFWQ